MASVIYPYGVPFRSEKHQVYKLLIKGSYTKVYHQNCGGVIIAKNNEYEKIKAKT